MVEENATFLTGNYEGELAWAGVVQKAVLNAVLGVELFTFVPLFVVSLYVVRVMCTTSILHLNMRLLFILQSVSSVLWAVAKTYSNVQRLLPNSHYPPRGTLFDQFLTRFAASTNILLTPILVVERILATCYVDSYERKAGRGSYALYALILATLGLSAIGAVKATLDSLYSQRDFDSNSAGIFVLNTAAGVLAYMVGFLNSLNKP